MNVGCVVPTLREMIVAVAATRQPRDEGRDDGRRVRWELQLALQLPCVM